MFLEDLFFYEGRWRVGVNLGHRGGKRRGQRRGERGNCGQETIDGFKRHNGKKKEYIPTLCPFTIIMNMYTI